MFECVGDTTLGIALVIIGERENQNRISSFKRVMLHILLTIWNPCLKSVEEILPDRF